MQPTAAARRASGVWDPAHRILTLGLVLTVSMAAFENLAVATILPATVAEIGGLEYYGWAFSAFMLAEIVGISVAGRAGDMYGPAPPFAVAGALFSAGLLGGGIAGSMPTLIAWRVVQGLGAGAISTLAYAVVARGYAEEARPRMLALLSTAWVVPGLIGPALAAGVHAYVGWRWVFLGLAPCSVASVALAMLPLRRLGPSGTGAAPRNYTAAFAVGLAVGVAAMLYGLSLDRASAGLAVGALGAAVAVPMFRRLTPPGTLRARPGSPAAVAVMALLSAAFFAAEVFVPLLLTEVRQRSVGFAGVALTAATVNWTAGAWLQARLAPRTSHRALVAVGLLILATGIAAIAAVLHPAVPAELAPAAWAVAGLGVGLAYSTVALVILESAPAGEESSASAAIQLANVLGTALGTGIGGAVLARFIARGGATAHAIALTDALALCAALAAAVLSLRLPDRQT